MWSKLSDYTNGPSLETNTAQNLSDSEGWVLCVARQGIPCSPESNIFVLKGWVILCGQARNSLQPRVFHLTFGIPLWPGQGSMPAAQNSAFGVLKDGTPLSPGHVSMLNRNNFKCVFERICTRVWPCQVLLAFSTELIFVPAWSHFQC